MNADHWGRLALSMRRRHAGAVSGDPFQTVAIAYSQPQALVLLSLFGWHGFPAYARGLEHARADCPMTLALGGIPIRVLSEVAEEARALLAEAAEREVEERAPSPLAYRIGKVLGLGVIGAAPPPRVAASIVPSYSAATATIASSSG